MRQYVMPLRSISRAPQLASFSPAPRGKPVANSSVRATIEVSSRVEYFRRNVWLVHPILAAIRPIPGRRLQPL